MAITKTVGDVEVQTIRLNERGDCKFLGVMGS